MRLINKIITKIKGQEFSLDTAIPFSYLFAIIIERLTMILRGKLAFVNNKGLLFIGKDVKIRAKKLVKLGKGVTIDSGCYIDACSKEGVVLGDNVSLGKRTVIECSGSLKLLGKGIKVGRNVGLGRDCFYGCAGGIEIGDNTIIGNFVSFHSENHNIKNLEMPIRLQGVNHRGILIGENCWIGAKVTILDGAVIHNGCVIAAGSVVTKGVYENNGIYGGVPARLIKRRI